MHPVSLAAVIDNIMLYGGASASPQADRYVFDMVIPVGGMHVFDGPPGVIASGDIAEELGMPVIVSVPARDGMPPRIGYQHLLRLSDFIRRKAKERQDEGMNYRVFVCCGGGHGRTGTMLAALIWYLELGKHAIVDPIAHLREAYCPKAVETEEQIAWLEEMGVPTYGKRPSRTDLFDLYDGVYNWGV